MSSFRTAIAKSTLFAMVCLVAPAASADDAAVKDEARRLYNEARQAMNDKSYREAALSFEGASQLIPHAVALYTAAQAWELAGDPARAADAYAKALATPKLNDAQATRSRERLKALEQKVGVVVVSGPGSVKVRLDEHMEVEPPARLHGMPGERTVHIIRADGKTETRSVTLVAGESTELDTEQVEEAAPPSKDEPKAVALAEPQTVPVLEVDSRKPGGPWRTIGYFTTGAGIATLGGATLLGLTAKDAEKTYNGSPTRDTLDHARSLQTKTNVMFIAGGVLTAAGVGLLIWQSTTKEAPPSKKASVSLRALPGSVVAEGSF